MSKDAKPSVRPPVNAEGLRDVKLLEAELMIQDAQLRNFTPSRDRLVASGQDANAMYRDIRSRRDHVFAELKKLRSVRGSVSAGSSVLPLHHGVLQSQLVPATFLPSAPGAVFGYSGAVQMGPAYDPDQEGVSPAGTTGHIYRVARNDTGGYWFGGDLLADNQPESKYFFWLHNWQYVVPFPAPVVTSTFSYSFKVNVQASQYVGGFAYLASFISLGETPNFVGQEILINESAGWPLFAEQYLPGDVAGQSTVQRSFVVQGGHVPAVAIALGMMAILTGDTEVGFDDYPTCSVIPSSVKDGHPGLVTFHYQPQLVVHP